MLEFDISIWRARRAFHRQRAAFFLDSALVLDAVSLQQILAMRIADHRGSPLGDACEDILSRYRAGASISACFNDYIPDGELQALRGWDAAANDKALAEGFAKVGNIAQAFEEIRRQLLKALTRATLALVLLFAILMMMHVSVYPSVNQIYPVDKWIAPARLAYFSINALFGHAWLLAAGVLALTGVYIWSLDNWSGFWRRRLDNSLPYGWWRSYRSLNALLALSLHLKARRGVNASLRLIMEHSGLWEYDYLDEMLLRNQSGGDGGEVFNVGFFDQQIMDRIRLLAATGSTEQAMERIAFTSQQELLSSFSRRIEMFGVSIKNIALIAGAAPVTLFFITLGDFITSVTQGGVRTF